MVRRHGFMRFEGTLSSPTFFNSIPLQMPHRMIMIRLGYRESRTELSGDRRDALERTMADGFALCSPQGCWTRLAIAEHGDERVVLEDGTVFESASLAKLLQRSTAAALLAATAGPEIVQAATDASAAEDGVTAIVYDAVGGQTAEAAISWVNDFIRQQLSRRGECLTKHRFSPGYGDLRLETQRDIHRLLGLDRLGISLTSSCMLIPEKSVTAVAGIEPMRTAEE